MAIGAMREKLAAAARDQQAAYAGDRDRPLRGYVITLAAYTGMVGVIAAGTRLTRRPVPDGFTLSEIALTAAATHKLSRLLSKDSVTSPLRAPFATYQRRGGPAELTEEARGQGVRKAVGELVTCPFCISVWVATGFAAGLIYLPKTTRITIGTLAALAGADALQFGYARLESAS